MNEDTVNKLAQALLDQTVWSELEYYVVVILLALILASLVAFFKTLYSEKAKFSAIESSLNTIKVQTELTASVTEKIRTDLEFQSWNKKEISQIRRSKLEQYMLLVMGLTDSFHKEVEVRFFNQSHEYDDQVWNKAQLIQNLYFPGLDDEHNELRKSIAKYKTWLAEGLSEIGANRQKGISNTQVSEVHMEEYTDILTNINNAVLVIQVKARIMSKELHT
ncbi:hypothetical protein [Vibrio lentus]|uniref:Uncharacterized protein n=1 Tax=Vibrio lentus TaxID=136468 RepID=A0A2N7IGN2_9VIBR|nr:hypothetical protein [Vibrio lentus]PML56381.1 hypothetical protein BCT74_20830 [Vibrio lentus]PMM33307.1 hypothetical protein BCT58_26760 [Vibrio lentus]